MSETTEHPQGHGHGHGPEHAHGGPEHSRSPWATGGTLLAGVLMLVDGLLGIVSGIAGIREDDVYGRIGDYVFELDTGAWGWIHLVLGIVFALAGCGIFAGQAWARIVGLVLAVVVVIANFIWLPYVPLWALVSIGIGVFVIWALSSDLSGSDV